MTMQENSKKSEILVESHLAAKNQAATAHAHLEAHNLEQCL